MIFTLRQRHRRTFALLGVLLPLTLAVGIAARRAVPQPDTLPLGLSAQSAAVAATEVVRRKLFDRSLVQVQLWREHGTARLAVGFVATKEFLKPDLLVYWAEKQPTNNDTLPPDAKLLGAFAAGRLALPAEASTLEGCLILFSLANQEIVDVSKPTRFTDAMK